MPRVHVSLAADHWSQYIGEVPNGVARVRVETTPAAVRSEVK